MQSTDSPTLSEADWWMPSPESFDDLTVTDTETGWELSAPDDTELAEWLSYWSQDEEHHAFFERTFLSILTDHAELVIENYGKNEDVPVGGHTDPEQAEDECPRVLPEHESGSDSEPSP